MSRAASAILPSMSAVAAYLRQCTADEMRAMTPAERVDLAFALGDEDQARYATASGLDRQTALRALRRARSVGRQPSVANEY